MRIRLLTTTKYNYWQIKMQLAVFEPNVDSSSPISQLEGSIYNPILRYSIYTPGVRLRVLKYIVQTVSWPTRFGVYI